MPAKKAFLDTNGWVALLNSSDTLHSIASTAWQDLRRQGCSIVLTDWVIAETGNGLARTSARSRFADAVELIRSSPHARIISISERLFLEALDLYTKRPDKTWGLVDCASFIVMEEEGINEAFTNDRHFVQAGLTCLLPLI
jgi:uncharacterized protein